MLPPLAIARVGQAALEGRELVLGAGVWDVGKEFAMLADQMQAPAQQVSRRPHRRRVHIRLRQHPAGSKTAILCESILSFLALPP